MGFGAADGEVGWGEDAEADGVGEEVEDCHRDEGAEGEGLAFGEFVGGGEAFAVAGAAEVGALDEEADGFFVDVGGGDGEGAADEDLLVGLAGDDGHGGITIDP